MATQLNDTAQKERGTGDKEMKADEDSAGTPQKEQLLSTPNSHVISGLTIKFGGRGVSLQMDIATGTIAAAHSAAPG